jgi:SpoVK/Ycf46/Vps4 family AAA+-type ATPase
VNSDWSRNAGRTGIGAIMGSKNLKAIVVRGTKDLPVFDINGLVEETRKAVKYMTEHKYFRLWQQQGLMNVIEPDPRGFEALGGFDNTKGWIGRRRRAWLPEAAAFGLPQPKGILVVGISGTGKSLCCKVIGTVLGIPTVHLDLGMLFNSLVGQSERQTRAALDLAEAMAPCILWIDEVEKGLAGAGSSGVNDGGVTKRIFGSIITWIDQYMVNVKYSAA